MNDSIDKTVIVGYDFTGLFTALHFSYKNDKSSVTLIDKNERFCFKLLLYKYLMVEMDDLQVLLKFTELLAGDGVTFVQNKVKNIELQKREVELRSGDIYKYNNLVLAVGSVPSYLNILSVQETTLPFYSQTDAIALDHL